MSLHKFTAIITPTKEDGATYFQVSVPALPEIITFGHSLEEATFMVQDALELVVLSRLEEGEIIPLDKKVTKLVKGSIEKEILVSVAHNVSASSADHVKLAFA